MHIVHITGYYPPHLGGMEQRIKELSEKSVQHGHTVEIITSNIGCKNGQFPSGNGLTIHYAKSIEFAHTPISFSFLYRLWKIPKKSVVHVHVAHALLPELTYLVCRLRGIPYLVTMHLDVDASGFFGFLLPWYKKYFLGPVIRHARAITVLTEDYKTLISHKYAIPTQHITVIPNGTYFTAAAAQKKTLHTPIRLLFVGRLSVQKNIPLLIRALHHCVHTYGMTMHLDIAGSGEKEAEVCNLIASLGLSSFVTMHGAVAAAEAQTLYRRSDIFVLPSTAESFGSVIIEAMASGTPVVATRILAVNNIIAHRKNGLLVDLDAEDMARAIHTLATNEDLRKKLIANGLEDVKKYNWQSVTQQYEAVYRTLLPQPWPEKSSPAARGKTRP